MKYAPLLLLLAVAPAQAGGWEWARTCPEDRAEIKRIARLTRYNCGALDAIVEQERTLTNTQVMTQYNRMLSSPQPLLPTPEVCPAPGPRTLFLPHY